MPELTPKLGRKHPVPQHIAAFEFKLIGDLTIKQFLFAGVGIAVAYAAWISDLNFFLKWGIILTSAGLGLGTAFFPIQDRTLDQWILNFILAIFSPTQRRWKKDPLPPEFLREDYSQFLTSQVLSLTPLQSRQKLERYLGGIEEKETITETEEEFIEKLNFDLPLPSKLEAPPASKKEQQSPPEPKEKSQLPPRKEVPEKPKLASEVNIALEKTYKVPLEKETKYVTTLQNVTPGRKMRLPTIEGTIRLRPEPEKIRPLEERRIPAPKPKEPLKELIKEKPKPSPRTQRGVGGNGRTEQLQKQNLELQRRLEEAEKQLRGLKELEEKRATDQAYRQRLQEQEKTVQKLSQKREETQKEISQARGEEFPAVPDGQRRIPNVISGVVKDKDGKLLENVIVIIKDQDDDPVRALKTNKLGQFAISTPLENGSYTVEISGKEKSFDIMEVTAAGSVLPPIEIKENDG